jgi:GT2 family glycosyltransferase
LWNGDVLRFFFLLETCILNTPFVHIIIVTWNGKDVTLECLESLHRIHYPSYRIVVVDNASTDGSAAALRKQYPEAIVLEQEQNLRFAGGNNAGMRYALDHGADMLCLLNNDTTVHPEFLTHLVHRMQSAADIGLVAPKIYYHDQPDVIWFAGGVISMWTGTMRHIGIRERDSGRYNTARDIDYATGCCMLVRREVVERVGMLDDTYFMYTEDADWCMRIRRAGYRIVYEPDACVWHKLSVSAGGHLSFYKMKNKFLSNLRFFFRYATLPQKLVFPWLNIPANALAAIRYAWEVRKK